MEQIIVPSATEEGDQGMQRVMPNGCEPTGPAQALVHWPRHMTDGKSTGLR